MSQVDFGIETQLITDNQIQAQINRLVECLQEAGIDLREININLPGEGSFIKTIIRAIEAGIITSFEPIIALINIIIEAIQAGISAPSVFIDRIVTVIEGITNLLADFPLSVIDFIVNKLIKPITDNINIPFPSTEIIIDILFRGVSINDLNWKQLFQERKLIIPEVLLNLPEEELNKILLIFESFEDSEPIFIKIIDVLLFPIKFAISLIQSVVDIVTDLVENLFDAIAKVIEIATGPVEFVIELIADIFGSVILEFIPGDIKDIPGFAGKFLQLIIDLFSGKNINIAEWIDNLPEILKAPFSLIGNLLQLISCLISWLLGLLTPTIILGLFGLSNFVDDIAPDFSASAWRAGTKSLSMTISGDVSINDINKIFKVGNKISISINNRNFESTITNIVNERIFISDLIFEDDVDQEFIIKPIF